MNEVKSILKKCFVTTDEEYLVEEKIADVLRKLELDTHNKTYIISLMVEEVKS